MRHNPYDLRLKARIALAPGSEHQLAIVIMRLSNRFRIQPSEVRRRIEALSQ